jgi:O-antigen ligase
MVVKVNFLLYFFSFIVFFNAVVRSLGIDSISEQTNKIDFLVLIVLIVFIFPLYKKANSISLKKLAIYFFGYILISLISSIRTFDGYALGQMLLNLKFPLLLFCFYLLDMSKINIKMLERKFLYLMFFNSFFIILELIYPSLHRSIFSGAINNTIIQGTNITRYTGFFIHPAAMGVFASLGLLWGTANQLNNHNRVSLYLILFSLFSLIFSGQRMELAACLAILLFVFSTKIVNKKILRVILLTLLFIFAVFLLLYFQKISSFNDNLINDGHARSVLYKGAYSLANEFFPLGSGLGTYGSSMSLSNENAMYQHLGISSYWWFEGSSFLTDTHWAMTIGESGYIGALFYLLFLLKIFYICYKNYIMKSNEKYNALLGCMLIAFSFISSLATPIYAGTLLPILIISIVVSLNLNAYDKNKGIC